MFYRGEKRMKVLFLDFDGVLNSAQYRKDPDLYVESPIELSKMPYVKEIVDSTGAKIVLTTSWRDCWSADSKHINRMGTVIDKIFIKFGIKVVGKTPERNFFRRDEEIYSFLRDNINVESFCILDDLDELFLDETIRRKHLVITNPEIGITDDNVNEAIKILNMEI